MFGAEFFNSQKKKMLTKHGFGNEDSENYVKVRIRRKEDFHFINVDLELESSESVQPLVIELGEKVFPLYCSEINEMANLEISQLNYYEANGIDFHDSYNDEKDLVGGVDVHINEFCSLIEYLSEDSKRIWSNCHRKEFDIGFQSGNTPKLFQTQIQSKTIRRCAELGATILITVYPRINYEMQRKKGLKK